MMSLKTTGVGQHQKFSLTLLTGVPNNRTMQEKMKTVYSFMKEDTGSGMTYRVILECQSSYVNESEYCYNGNKM